MAVTMRDLSLAGQWVYILSAWLSFCFFCFQLRKGRCKWEVLYVSFMGGLIAFLKVYMEHNTLNKFTILENGRVMPWLRYVGWLITCPVLLIHLGNLPGETNFDMMRLMKMLVGLQLMVVCAASATVLETNWHWVLYFLGWCSMSLVFRQAFEVFYEAITIFPPEATNHVKIMALMFFSSWCGFAIFFFFSPHGINAYDTDTTNFLFSIADDFSKTGWGLMGWYLRWNILRKADGSVKKEVMDALHMEKKAKVLVVDNDMVMAHYLLGKLIAMNYDPAIASNPDEMYSMLDAGMADVIIMEYGVAEAGEHSLPRDIFNNYRLPVVCYGYDIPVNTFYLRSKHITDSIHGLPGDDSLDDALERWAPVPGMEDTYARPAKQVPAKAEPAVIARSPSFTEKAAVLFGGAKPPPKAPAEPSPPPSGATTPGRSSQVPPHMRSPSASPRSSVNYGHAGMPNMNGMGGGMGGGGMLGAMSGQQNGMGGARGGAQMAGGGGGGGLAAMSGSQQYGGGGGGGGLSAMSGTFNRSDSNNNGGGGGWDDADEDGIGRYKKGGKGGAASPKWVADSVTLSVENVDFELPKAPEPRLRPRACCMRYSLCVMIAALLLALTGIAVLVAIAVTGGDVPFLKRLLYGSNPGGDADAPSPSADPAAADSVDASGSGSGDTNANGVGVGVGDGDGDGAGSRRRRRALLESVLERAANTKREELTWRGALGFVWQVCFASQRFWANPMLIVLNRAMQALDF
mmetsp:Transcript_36408/g.89725  ORF Transcript_36408/g.89725 Transcript_36408/m.89725 type:complete len:743 (-) Transcript_36408:64-2292(-)